MSLTFEQDANFPEVQRVDGLRDDRFPLVSDPNIGMDVELEPVSESPNVDDATGETADMIRSRSRIAQVLGGSATEGLVKGTIEDYNQQTGNKLLYVGVRGLSAQHPYRQRIYQLGGLTTDPEGHVLPVVVVGDNHKAVVPADKGVQVLVAVNRNALHDARQSNMITPKSRSTFKQ